MDVYKCKNSGFFTLSPSFGMVFLYFSAGQWNEAGRNLSTFHFACQPLAYQLKIHFSMLSFSLEIAFYKALLSITCIRLKVAMCMNRISWRICRKQMCVNGFRVSNNDKCAIFSRSFKSWAFQWPQMWSISYIGRTAYSEFFIRLKCLCMSSFFQRKTVVKWW